MHDRPDNAAAQALATGVAIATRNRPDRANHSFDGEDNWLFIAGGIAIAGGVYPLVLLLIGLAVGVVRILLAILESGVHSIYGNELFAVPVVVAIYAVVAIVVGMLWAAVVSLFVMPVFYLFVRSLRLRANLIWLGAGCGGLVGFVAVLPFTLAMWPQMDGRVGEMIVVLVLGPGLTTVLGQLGGAWGANRPLAREAHYKEAVARATDSSSLSQLESSARPKNDGAGNATSPRFQFRIRHLLWIFVWLSLLLSVIRLSGIAFEFILPLLAGWVLYQTLTLWAGGVLVRRLGPWWAARRGRST